MTEQIQPVESDETHDDRCARMRAVLQETADDLVDITLGVLIDEPHRHIVDAMYARLEALPTRDLALAVVLAIHRSANERANKLWSALQTAKPEDVS